MLIDVLTIFPEIFRGPLTVGMIRQALDRGLVRIRIRDLRDFCTDAHRTTDDYPYGGGPGMVLKPEPIFRAVDHVRRPESRVILLTPQGTPFTQELAHELAGAEHCVFICGRYEGVDERVRQNLATTELSIGDYVLTGGELPALVVLETVLRLVPGLLKEDVARQDSFGAGLLEGPQYTRPAEYRGLEVPKVLLSGHHERIARWRHRQALKTTLERRPELLEHIELSEEDQDFLNSIRQHTSDAADNETAFDT